MASADPSPSSPPADGAAPGRSVVRNASHLLLGQVVTTLLAVALSAVLGRSLGAADFGLFFLVSSMGTFAYVVADWGQSQYVIREVARHPDRAGEILGSALLLRSAGAALLAGFTVLAAWALGYDGRTRLLAALFIGSSLPFFLAQAYGLVFRGRERMELDAMLAIANRAVALGATVAALALGTGLVGALAAPAAGGFAALVLAGLFRRRLPSTELRWSAAEARELLAGGAPLLATSLAIAAQTYLDAVIISKLAPSAQVGWYGAARNILGTLVAPATILGTASFPGLSRAASDPIRLQGEVRSSMRPLLGLAALAGVGTYLFADLAIAIVYGKRGFGPAAIILQVFAPGLFLLFVDVLLGTVIVALGRPVPLAVAKVVNVALTTVLDIVLIPYFQASHGNGGIGVVVAFGGSEIIMFAAALWILPRGLIDRSMALDAGRALAAGGLTLLLFRALPPLSPFLALPLCVVAYLALAVLLGLVRGPDLERVKAAVRRRRGA